MTVRVRAHIGVPFGLLALEVYSITAARSKGRKLFSEELKCLTGSNTVFLAPQMKLTVIFFTRRGNRQNEKVALDIMIMTKRSYAFTSYVLNYFLFFALFRELYFSYLFFFFWTFVRLRSVITCLFILHSLGFPGLKLLLSLPVWSRRNFRKIKERVVICAVRDIEFIM